MTGAFGELIDADLKSFEWKETYTTYFSKSGQHGLKEAVNDPKGQRDHQRAIEPLRLERDVHCRETQIVIAVSAQFEFAW